MKFAHTTVLLQESIANLNCQPDKVYVDCTLGGGGHSEAILQAAGPSARLIAIDQDKDALLAASKRLELFREQIIFVHSNFSRLDEVLKDLKIDKVAGMMFDLGVSSYQLDNPERGFSYMQDAPLDMRMDVESALTASDLLHQMSEQELAKIIWEYGEERWSKRIAGFIVEARKNKRLETTGDLVEVIKAAVPAGARRSGPHPAKRTFQALRIAVNNELGIIKDSLLKGIDFLEPGGRICVISFHSLEDRLVKHTFREQKQEKTVQVLTKKPILPSDEEVNANPRARSAKLRVAEKMLF